MEGEPNGVNWEQLPSKQCTMEQLGLTTDAESGEIAMIQGESKSLFYPTHRNSVYDLSYYYKKLKCLDSENIRIQGDYNSGVTRSFVIQFTKCD